MKKPCAEAAGRQGDVVLCPWRLLESDQEQKVFLRGIFDRFCLIIIIIIIFCYASESKYSEKFLPKLWRDYWENSTLVCDTEEYVKHKDNFSCLLPSNPNWMKSMSEYTSKAALNLSQLLNCNN